MAASLSMNWSRLERLSRLSSRLSPAAGSALVGRRNGNNSHLLYYRGLTATAASGPQEAGGGDRRILPARGRFCSFISSSRFFQTTPNFQRQGSLKEPIIATATTKDDDDWSIPSNLLRMIQKPTKGKGFDNFLPPGDGDDDKAGSSKEEKQRGGDGNNQGGGGDNNNNNNRDPYNTSGWMALAVLLGLAYLLQPTSSSDSSRDNHGHGGPPQRGAQREITWHEFLRLLQQREVIKIVVSTEANAGGAHNESNSNQQGQQQMARVYLKPNARGLAHYHNHHGQQHGGHNEHHHPDQHQHFYEHQDNNNNSQDSHNVMQGINNMHNNDDGGISNDQQQQFALSSLSQQSNSNSFLYYKLPIGSIDAFERKLDEAQRALGLPEAWDVPVQYKLENAVTRELLGIVPGLLMAGALYGMMRFGGAAAGRGAGGGAGGGMGGIFQIGKSTAKKISKEDVKINFSDVAGCEEAKKEIMEFVDFLKDSDRFTKLGAKIPKGALLCGPPGTGKTLLAKAVAGEAGVPFYSISGSDFIEMFVGVGPSRVRDLFQEARQNAPCIVFIDEIDAVGRQRGRGGVGGNDERENTLNQLLVEMDGFSTSTGVVVLAGTNRVDILDQALTRPGRFDRQITVDKPDLKGRKAIFKVHLQGITLEDSIDDVAGRLAGLTPGFAGADIANICNEAAIVAARRKGESVSMEDFENATDRIIGGLESNKIMSMEERSIVAHHEAGHAVAGWFLEHADPLLKVTIIPRSSGALGFAQYLPKEVFLRTQDQIMDIVCMALAGRASEEIFFGRVTTGASDDLKRVTQLVYSTIQLYGMNSRLGQLSFPKDPNAMFEDRPYSEKTAKAMDEEAKAIVDAAYERTLSLLREKKDQVESVAKLLLDKETITHDDMIDTIGKRPFKGDTAYEEFIRRRKEKTFKDGSSSEKDKDDAAGEDGTDLNPGLV